MRGRSYAWTYGASPCPLPGHRDPAVPASCELSDTLPPWNCQHSLAKCAGTTIAPGSRTSHYWKSCSLGSVAVRQPCRRRRGCVASASRCPGACPLSAFSLSSRRAAVEDLANPRRRTHRSRAALRRRRTPRSLAALRHRRPPEPPRRPSHSPTHREPHRLTFVSCGSNPITR